MKKLIKFVPLILLSMIFLLTSCKEISAEEQIVIYNSKTYEYTEDWVPIEKGFDEVEAYFGKETAGNKKENKTVYLLKNCGKRFIRIRIENSDYIYRLKDDTPPSYQNGSTVTEIRVVSDRSEQTVNPELYKSFIEHIIQNKENSYLASKTANLIGDVVVYYEGYPAAQIIGKIIYDNDGILCFSDDSLPPLENHRWVYPLPADILSD